jgi:hypothetical protein
MSNSKKPDSTAAKTIPNYTSIQQSQEQKHTETGAAAPLITRLHVLFSIAIVNAKALINKSLKHEFIRNTDKSNA